LNDEPHNFLPTILQPTGKNVFRFHRLYKWKRESKELQRLTTRHRKRIDRWSGTTTACGDRKARVRAPTIVINGWWSVAESLRFCHCSSAPCGLRPRICAGAALLWFASRGRLVSRHTMDTPPGACNLGTYTERAFQSDDSDRHCGSTIWVALSGCNQSAWDRSYQTVPLAAAKSDRF
jgi:hypothetical protein